MRQAGIIAAGAHYALDHHVERLAEDHEHAVILAGHLAQVHGLAIPHPVETNIVVIDVGGLGLTAEEAVGVLAEAGVLAGAASRTLVRFVTHLDVSPEQVQWAADTAADVLERYGEEATGAGRRG
jgi:threonine aldolase